MAAIATLTATSQFAWLMQGTAGYQKEAAKDASGDEGRGQLLHVIENYSHPEIDTIRVRLTRYSKTNVSDTVLQYPRLIEPSSRAHCGN